MAPASDESFATRLYHDRDFDIRAAKVLPGEYYATDRDMAIVTVLGSCVSACIRDVETGIGGLNHFMLPESHQGDDGTMNRPARYGTYAMEVLINHILEMGARRERLEAKVFGGGNVLAGLTVANVGERNAAFVLRFLKTDRIRVVAQDLVDVHPRKVYFFPRSGKVMVRKLRDASRTVLEHERDYGSRLKAEAAPADVELFS